MAGKTEILCSMSITRSDGLGYLHNCCTHLQTQKALVGKPEGKNHLEDLGIDGRIILKCTLEG
jgi:hypothetical protein